MFVRYLAPDSIRSLAEDGPSGSFSRQVAVRRSRPDRHVPGGGGESDAAEKVQSGSEYREPPVEQ